MMRLVRATADITSNTPVVHLTTHLSDYRSFPNCQLLTSESLLQPIAGIRQNLPINGTLHAYHLSHEEEWCFHSAGRERGFPQFV
jgi:hypothetical protein